MGQQMELQFDHDWNDRSIINHHESIIQIEEAKTAARMEHDDKTYDDLCIIQCDIEEAAESGDQDRLIELIQMRTAYEQ